MSVFTPKQEKIIKKRIQTEFEGPSKFWKQQVLGKFALCPYCGEIGASIGDINDMVEEQYHHFVSKCSSWGNWQGELIALNRLQNLAREIEIKHMLVNDPLWHYFDQGGNWYCPSCAQPVPSRYNKFKKLDLKSIKAIQEHCMITCQNSKKGRLQKYLSADFLKRTVAIANAAIKLVPEIQQLMRTEAEWVKKSPDGAWSCPFCFEVIEKIDISTKFNMLEKAPEIAIHLVTRCVKFQTHYKKYKKCKIDYTLDSSYLQIPGGIVVEKDELASSPSISISQDDLPDFLKPAPKTSPEKEIMPNVTASQLAAQRGTLKQIQADTAVEKLYTTKEALKETAPPKEILPAHARVPQTPGVPAGGNVAKTPPPAGKTPLTAPPSPQTPQVAQTPSKAPQQYNTSDQSFFEATNPIQDGIMEVYAIPSDEEKMPTEWANASGAENPTNQSNGFYAEETFASGGEEDYENSGSFSNLPLFNIQPGTQTIEDYLPDWMSDEMETQTKKPMHSQFSSDIHKPFVDKDSKVSTPLKKEEEEDIFRILDNELFLESTFKIKPFKAGTPFEPASSQDATVESVLSTDSTDAIKKPGGGTSKKIIRRVKRVLKADPALLVNLNQSLPKIPSDLPFEIKVLFNSSPRIGGDFYNVYQLDETQFVFHLSSTSLKGQAAIDFNVKFCELLKENVSTKSLVASLCRVNELVYPLLGNSHYASVFLGVLDMSSWQIRFSNAGHSSLLIYNLRNKDTRTVSTHGIVMGANQGSFFRTVLTEEEVQLTPDTILIQYSNGTIEQINEARQPWGFQAFYNVLVQNAARGVDGMLAAVDAELKTYIQGQPQKDDFIVSAMRL